METSHFIPTSSIGKPGWYNKFREQNCLLNQSSSKITIISNLDRYPEIWGKKIDHNPPEELANGVRISGISVKNNVVMPPSYLFHYSLVVRKTRLEEKTLISLTGFKKKNLVNMT